MFHYTRDIPVPVDKAISKLEQSLKDEQFGVLWQFDIRDKLQEKGVDFDKNFTVLEICNPHEAKKVLEEESLASYFLPCKIVVYEEDNRTKIGMPKPTALITMVENDKLKAFAADIEERLIRCIDAVQ
ncbi:DUF302 domain-containing protein [Siminovitchia acidinfaciens]|uniref:DUF302 domain-containing protein n=1 Tax=Siminovitchia acidinfaciens TaxID=2321395 RepID=A0A429Y7X9_9BACI|nr:DUF302 domain-containing protein [Siminovitchia acidinfaciens]RST77535.1 DUF302 domain-containing protein [Siminovitchia acidinfaciens]